MLEPFFIN